MEDTMKKKLLVLILVFVSILLPISVNAEKKEYNILDFEGALADEEIEKTYREYSPKSDAITIYLFRGKGCGFCRAFLTFLDTITDEYGQYFKLESYEVWNDQNNASLLDEVSNYLGQAAGGVPYIVIGDKVFAGYSSEYDDAIKEKIVELYNTKKNKRYDVLKEIEKNPKKDTSETGTSAVSVVVWQLAFTVIATAIIISYVNLKFKELNVKLDDLKVTENKPIKKEKKK